MRKRMTVGTKMYIVGAIIALLGIIGWIMNIIALASASFDPITGLVVLRVAGIFLAPLGAVLGYI